MPSITVQRFTQMHRGKPVDLYLAAVPAAELAKRKAIDIQTQHNPRGYQRAPSESRVRSIGRYVLNGEGLLPTAVLVNIRGGAHFEPLESDDRVGQLHFDEVEPWWVADGQHRTLGVEDAATRRALTPRAGELGYDLPVVFTLGFTQPEEMDVFEIVNSKAKSVPTDLVASIIFNRVTGKLDKGAEAGEISIVQLRKAAGVAVGHYLADRLPWKGHVQQVNEAKDVTNKPMQANTFAATLRPVLRERWVHTRFLSNPDDREFTNLSRIVQTYWEALAELMPEAFADIARYQVQRPIGVYAFHELLPEVLDACRMEGDFSRANFAGKLRRLEEWVESATWHRETGEDIVRGSGNRTAIRVVVDRMRTLYHAPLTGLEG